MRDTIVGLSGFLFFTLLAASVTLFALRRSKGGTVCAVLALGALVTWLVLPESQAPPPWRSESVSTRPKGPCDHDKLEAYKAQESQGMMERSDPLAILNYATQAALYETHCAESLPQGDIQDAHYLSIAESWIIAGVYGGSAESDHGKGDFSQARTVIQVVLADDNASRAIRGKAQDMMESVNEKLAALRR